MRMIHIPALLFVPHAPARRVLVNSFIQLVETGATIELLQYILKKITHTDEQPLRKICYRSPSLLQRLPATRSAITP